MRISFENGLNRFTSLTKLISKNITQADFQNLPSISTSYKNLKLTLVDITDHLDGINIGFALTSSDR